MRVWFVDMFPNACEVEYEEMQPTYSLQKIFISVLDFLGSMCCKNRTPDFVQISASKSVQGLIFVCAHADQHTDIIVGLHCNLGDK